MNRWVIIYFIIVMMAGCTGPQAAGPSATGPAISGGQKEVVEFRETVNAKATDVAKILRQLLPITVEADPITNTVIVSGRAVYVVQAADIINKLDSQPWDLTPDVRFIQRLKYAQARDVVMLLRDMAAQGFFDVRTPDLPPPPSPPMFDADDGQNMVIVRVPRGFEGRVRQVLEAIDQQQEAK